MAKITDFEILTAKTTDELTALVKARIADGWEPMEAGFHVEYLDQTAANYVFAMIKTAPERKAKSAKKKTTGKKSKTRKK